MLALSTTIAAAAYLLLGQPGATGQPVPVIVPPLCQFPGVAARPANNPPHHPGPAPSPALLSLAARLALPMTEPIPIGTLVRRGKRRSVLALDVGVVLQDLGDVLCVVSPHSRDLFEWRRAETRVEKNHRGWRELIMRVALPYGILDVRGWSASAVQPQL